MKKQHIFLLTLALCIGLLSVSTSYQYLIQPTQGTLNNVTFAKDLKVEMQKKPMKIIALKQPTKDDLYKFRRLVQKELANAKRDPSIHYTVDGSRGLISFNRGMEKYNGDFKPNLPSPKAAVEVGMNFLRKSKMIPNEVEQLKLVHNGGLRAAYVLAKKKSITIDKLRTLTYGREIDGIPVSGEGSKIVINIGHNNAVVSVIHKWKNTTGKMVTVSPKQMKSASIAKKEIQSLLSKEFSSKAEVRVIQQVYYNGNGKYIQPVYAFEALIHSEGSKKPIPYYGMIPALFKTPEAVDFNRKIEKQAQEYIKKTNQRLAPKIGKEKLD